MKVIKFFNDGYYYTRKQTRILTNNGIFAIMPTKRNNGKRKENIE